MVGQAAISRGAEKQKASQLMQLNFNAVRYPRTLGRGIGSATWKSQKYPPLEVVL
jgi:hypothetical protein